MEAETAVGLYCASTGISRSRWRSFEDFLAAMIAESGNVYKGWQFFSFEQKRGIFDETKLCFSQCPVILASLSALMEDTKPQQIKHNVLVPGTTVLKIK